MSVFDKTVWVVVMLAVGWLACYIALGMYQSARKTRPMATRVTRSKWEDSKPHDSRDWQGAFRRIVSGK